jgi:hypothetical protein
MPFTTDTYSNSRNHLGDVNGDGLVNYADITAIKNYISSRTYAQTADLNLPIQQDQHPGSQP